MHQYRLFTVLITLVLLTALYTGCTKPTPTTPEPSHVPEPTIPPSGSEAVAFPDKNLDEVIREALGKPLNEEITAAELARLTTLCAGTPPSADRGITDISGLEYCTNLTELSLSGNPVSDISPLSSLTNLNWLELDGSPIGDISLVSPLTNLTSLSLIGCQISDISPLANLTNLMWLDISGNQISDISPLIENHGMGSGDDLWLKGNNLDLRAGSEAMENIRALEGRGAMVHLQDEPTR